MRSKTSRSSLGRLVPALGALWLTMLPRIAMAAGSDDMPWSTLLQRLVNNFTGVFARSLIIIAIVLLGIALAFSEGFFLRRILGVLLGGALAAAAGSFALTFFGFTSGATF